MKSCTQFIKPLIWFLAVSVAGCGGGQSPILGGGGVSILSTVTDTTKPWVSAAVPVNLGSIAANASITATFNEAMTPATITAAPTFTVKETISGTNVPGGQ